MATSIQDIEARYRQRVSERGPRLARAKEVARQYDGDVIVELPELDENEKSMAVNLLGPGLDQLATRIASTMPDISCTPVRTTVDTSINRAAMRRRAMLSWWDMNRMDMILRRRARYLLGYASSPVIVSHLALNPADKRKIPHWRVLNPLSVFAAPTYEINDIEPSDVILAFTQPLSWLQAAYPEEARILFKGRGATPDTLFEILEFNDAEETVLVALGQSKENVAADQPRYGMGARPTENVGTEGVVQLERTPNRAGICLAVVPGRITLNKPQGMFDQLLGVFHNASKLAALEYIAVKGGTLPDQYLVSHPNAPGQASIVVPADGLLGQIGEIRNGVIQTIVSQPAPALAQMQDRLERVGRLAGGLPAELGGESATNIRTARRGEAVLGAAIDMPVQEHQEIFEDSLEAENRRAVAVSKSFWGSTPTSFYIPRNGKIPSPDYTPNEIFETDQHVVKYGITGTDANSFVIAMGQRLQMETISPETFMEMDPVVEDVQQEMARIWTDGGRKALMSSLETRAANGQLDPTFFAKLTQALRGGETNLEDALIEVNKAMQAEQAAAAAAQGPPGAAPSPGAMPGIAGAPGVQGGVPMPPPGQGALAQILSNLRKPAAQGPAENAMAAAAPSPLAQ